MRLWSRIYRLAAAAIVLFLAFGCGTASDVNNAEVIFTANGAVLTHIADADVATMEIRGDGQTLLADVAPRMDSIAVPFEWKPGVEYVFSAGSLDIRATAPQRPSIALVGSIDYGENLLSLKAGEQPSSASSLAISPSGRTAAIGTNDGDVILLSLVEGRIISRKRRAGSYIRTLIFIDDSNLVVGEQAPAGSIIKYEVSSGNLKEIWRFDAGDTIGRGTYDESDPYSWAHQPGIYRMQAGGDGSVFAVASYSPFIDGQRQARWAAFNLNVVTGDPKWIYESNEETAGVATWFGLDESKSNMALCVGMDSGEGALLLINTADGTLISEEIIQPLRPHLTTVSFWQGVDISTDGQTVYAISNDGRALIWNPGSRAETILLGEPILVDNLPILISGVGVVAGTDAAYCITGTTYIPWEISEGETAPQIHHAANTVFAINEANISWSVPIPNLCQGYALGKEGRWLYTSFASNPVYSPDSGAGLAIIRIDENTGKLAATYSVNGTIATGSPVLDSKNGFILVVENRRRSTDGDRLEGEAQAHVLYW